MIRAIVQRLPESIKRPLNRLVNWIWRKVVGVPLQGQPEDEEPRRS